MKRTRHGLLVAIGVVLLLQGCAIYSPERDKQGKAAKEAWAKVDLTQQTQLAGANLDAALATQLTSVEEAAAVRREALILTLSTLRVDTASQSALSRAATLSTGVTYLQADGGVTPVAYPCKLTSEGVCSFAEVESKWTQALLDERAATEAYRRVQDHAARFGVSWPASCAVLLKDPKPSSDALSGQVGLSTILGGFEKVKSLCEGLLKAQADQRALAPRSPWVTAEAAAKSARDDFENQKKITAAARKEAKDAKKDIEAEEKSDTPNRQKLQQATARLSTAVTTVKAAQDLFSFEFISAEKQESLDAAFKAIADSAPGKPVAVGTGKSVSALILFADFFDATSKRLKEDDEHSITGLVLEKRLAAVQQAVAQEAIKRLELGVQLKEQRAEVLREQLERYFTADRLLRTATPAQLSAPFLPLMLGSTDGTRSSPRGDKARKAGKAPAPGTEPGDAENLWLGLGFYIDANTRLQALSEHLRFKQIALDRAESVSLAAGNLASWKTLIDANVEQLSAWAASGIKEEQIAALFDAVAKFAIAFGVNNK